LSGNDWREILKHPCLADSGDVDATMNVLSSDDTSLGGYSTTKPASKGGMLPSALPWCLDRASASILNDQQVNATDEMVENSTPVLTQLGVSPIISSGEPSASVCPHLISLPSSTSATATGNADVAIINNNRHKPLPILVFAHVKVN